MADAPVSEAVFMRVQIPLSAPFSTSDSSTDRIPGYEPDDVGSIPPLTTISLPTR